MVLCIVENNYLSYFKLLFKMYMNWIFMWIIEIFIFLNGVMYEI